ncbi:TonB-dependent receptor [Tenacibaculum ovolyticum]|uniref:SusC/RagA family TonB-linked outer membrane protein n=1 Tax=Tenacibaculum ovolyticum TaxID=104270 RepID=UPI0022F3E3C4|nr:TonB-dependent receptor [Tenacibaculum ovolyticum]WBX77829.1 TonB-dependent receptor [Tenacibaculum ovolyticum]
MKHFFRKRYTLLLFIFISNIVLAQTIVVKGKVKDESGVSLPGVSVVVKGTTNGIQTDFDGNYTIETLKGKTLMFSFVGMEKVNVIVSNANVLNISMKESTNELEEIVLTGYTKQSTKNITGSVTVVKMKDIEATAPVSIEQSLQGQASGVTIGAQGGPGGNTMVRIRGFATINNNDPLFVIDGNPTSSGLNQLNPNDIESIQILKDASSAAIYGVGASNGVVIITTKNGKYNNTTKMTFSATTGIDYVSKSDFPKSITPQELANTIWKRFENDGTLPTHPQYGSGTVPILPNYLTPTGSSTADLSTYDSETNKITRANKAGTNWFDEYFNPALVNNYNIGLSGGSEKSKFHVGVGVLKQEGIALHSSFDRYNLSLSSEFKVKESIRFGETLNLSYSEKTNNTGNQSTGGDISFLYRADPILPIYDIAGNYAGTQSTGLGNGVNSVANAIRNKDNLSRTLRALASFYGEFEIIDNLTLKSNIGIDYSAFHSSAFNFINSEISEPSATNSLNESTFYSTQSTWYNTLNYRVDFGNHKIETLIGSEFKNNNFKQFGASRSIFFTNNIDYRYLSRGTGTQTNFGYGDRTSLFSLFGKLDYNYNDTYLASFIYRRDGSSKFGSNNRYANFSSYSAAWRISNEKFMENVSFIDDLKIKAGYGEYGNESIGSGRTANLYGNDETTSSYDISGSNSSVQAGYFLQSLGNPNIKWETSTNLNIGLEGSLFDKKLNFSIEYYKAKTIDMLLSLPSIPILNGTATPPVGNIGTMENKGFDFSIGYNGNINDDLKFTTSANISTYKNKITRLNDDPNFFLSGNAARETYPSRTQEGHPLASFFGFINEGIIQNNEELDAAADFGGKDIGTFKYKDINGDGKIDDSDQTFIGNPHPDFTYGLNLGLEYKGFDLSVLFQGSQGNDIYNFTKFFTDFNSFPGGKSYRYLNSWTPENTNAVLPKLTNSPATHYSSASSYYIEDGSYLRLKNIQIGYNLPKQLTDKLGMNDLRIYLQGKNLITWTKYSGLDPEINLQSYGGGGNTNLDIGIDRGAYPVSKSILLGINLSL